MSLAKIQNAMQEMNLIASNMESMIKLATYLARDGWTAQSLVSAYLSYGIKYGWTMAEILDNMHNLKGKPAFQVHALFGLALSSGKVRYFKTVSTTATECVIECQRNDQPKDIKHTIKFTIEMARQQGLASSQQWQKMPQQMLFARCRSMAVREVFADVISGYDVMEMADSLDMPEHERLALIDESEGTALAKDAKLPAKAQPKAQSKPEIAPVPVKVEEPADNITFNHKMSEMQSKQLTANLIDHYDEMLDLKNGQTMDIFMGNLHLVGLFDSISNQNIEAYSDVFGQRIYYAIHIKPSTQGVLVSVARL